eukprot:3140635-Amphidinium_carterae.1
MMRTKWSNLMSDYNPTPSDKEDECALQEASKQLLVVSRGAHDHPRYSGTVAVATSSGAPASLFHHLAAGKEG